MIIVHTYVVVDQWLRYSGGLEPGILDGGLRFQSRIFSAVEREQLVQLDAGSI